jgi:hypothetical protein
MKKSIVFLAATIAILFCGCKTTAMKGTPFYTGEHDKREGPASDRVNLWPLAYYRDPALSILWPIGEFADDRFAIRPLFSMYRDGKDEPWHEYNSLGGLISVDTKNHRHMFFPLYYRDSEEDTFLSLLYAQGENWYAIPPLLSWWNNYEGRVLLGLGGWDNSSAWAFPLFYRDTASKTLITPLWASQDENWYVIPPLLSGWSHDPSTGGHSLYLLAGLAGFKPDTDWIFPLYLRNKNDDSFISLFYAHDRDWSAIPPLLSWWDADSGHVLLGLGGWDDSREWAFPFFYRNTASKTLVTPLWASQAGHWSAIPPLLSWQSRDPATGDSSLYLLGGLAGFEPDTDWIFPLYYRNEKDDILFSLPYAHGRDWSAIPPLLSWWKNDGSGRVLLGLGGWDANAERHWVFPFYTRDAANGSFGSLLYAYSRDWHIIPPLLTKWDGKGSGRALLGLGGWGPDESWLFPFWYRDSDELLTLLWGRSSWGTDHFTYWFTPLFGTRSGSKTGSWLFPLWDIERFDSGSWNKSFLLLCGTRGGPREAGRTSFWIWPVFSYETNPKRANLQAEMDAQRAPDRQFYREEDRSIWNKATQTHERQRVIASVRDNAGEESTFLLGIGGSEHHVALNPYSWEIARKFGETTAKGSLARFTDPNAAHVQPPPESSTLPTNAAARYLSEDSSWFFPLWSHERKRGVMFDLPSGEKSLDAEIETFRALLFLYDWRHESLPEENHDYARRRVLWRLYHYERLGDAESTDIFPAITYDRRKDGYSKFSFLWRFFRYERDPKKGTYLDILFIPMRRP